MGALNSTHGNARSQTRVLRASVVERLRYFSCTFRVNC